MSRSRTADRHRSIWVAATILALAACHKDATAPNSTTGKGATPGTPTPGPPAPTPPPPGSAVAPYEAHFLEFMIDHHLGGVALATRCSERAVHEELRALCHHSLADQQRQIALFRSWLRQWYGVDYAGTMHPSAEANVQRLSAVSGTAFENDFLTTFSAHHVVTIVGSRQAVGAVPHDELRHEAQLMVTNQTHQVMAMQAWDCHWYGDCS
jgi:uncharacterized protein (DUF305 family)